MNDPKTPPAASDNGAATDAPPVPKTNRKRRTGLLLLAGVVLVAGIAWGAWEWLVARNYEGTDNAYVQGNVVQVTPQVGGTVIAIHAEDTDFVKAGQPLAELDPADAKLALVQAESALGSAVRQVRTLYANNATLSAQIAARQADVVKAQAELSRASDDYARRRSLADKGAVSREDLRHAQVQAETGKSAVAAAQAGVTAAREQLASNRTMTEGTSVEQHPLVQAAAARVREAWLALKRTTLPAPVDGYVARRTVQLGQRVAPGTPLLSLIPLGQVWVDANFKEGQLANIRIGQPVKATADVYGSKVEYDGKVAGLSAGTGSAFALLPAQNATGNWIKVVQRVPVRIELDPKQLKEHPLRIGLSMEVTADVHDKNGRVLSSGAAAPASQTQVYGSQDDGAERAVRRVIAANGGQAAAPQPQHSGGTASAPPQDQKAY